MKRSSSQQFSLIAALVLGVAPFAFGVVRAVSTGDDYRFLWMSLAPSFFVAGLLAAAIGRRRTRKAVRTQAIVIFVGVTVLATVTAVMFGESALPVIVGVAAMYGALLSLSSILVALSRAGAH